MVLAQHSVAKKRTYEWRIDLKDTEGAVPTPGDVVGLDVVVMDADGEERRDFSLMKWGGRDHSGGRRSDRRGDLLLMERGPGPGLSVGYGGLAR